MEPSLIQIHVWAYGSAALVFGLFALYLGFGWRGAKLGGRLLIAVTLSAAWVAVECLDGLWWPSSVLPSVTRVLDVARLAGWAIFLRALLSVALPPEVKQPTSLRYSGWVVFSVALVVSALSDALGIANRWQIFSSLALSVWMLTLVEQVYRNFPPGARWDIKPLCLGLAGVQAFDLYLFADGFLFTQVDQQVYAVRGAVHALVTPLIAMSAARSRDWTFRITVSRELVFHTAALAASGIYLLVIAAAGYYVRWFGGSWGRSLQAALLFSGLLLFAALVFSGSLRSRLRVWLNKNLFAYRYDYRNAWLKFTQSLSSPVAGQSLEQSVIGALADLVESPSGVIWLRESDGFYRPRAKLNQKALEGEEAADGHLCRLLREQAWIINIAEWRNDPAPYEHHAMPQWLAESGDAWLIVPLLSAGELTGFVVLANARAPVEVNWEVLDLLKTAGRQAASYLAQAQAMAALLEAQKFDSFNRMSAFVVHDLKNLVAQLSLMIKNAARHKDNPEFQADMLSTVEHVAERMRGLMTQLQNKSPIEQKRIIDLAEVCASVINDKRGTGHTLVFSGAQSVTVSAHGERLERIIGHVVQNAMEATPEHGKVEIALAHDGNRAKVEVRDSGSGMSAEFVRERLFKPFQSTKQNGMGIGAYEVQQYVHELGGNVVVDSEAGRGTCFTIYLPLSDRSERVAA